MGAAESNPQGNSQNSFGNMNIILDKSVDKEGRIYYSTGEILRGSIKLSIFKDVEHSGLYMQLKGEESTYFYDSTTKEGSEGTSFSKKVEIINRGEELKIEGGRLCRGKHNYPFEVEIPGELPSSFMHKQRNQEASIIYTMGGYLGNRKEGKWCLVFRTPIYICKNEGRLVESGVGEDHSAESGVKCCVCCFYGRCRMFSSVEEERVRSKEMVRLRCNIDNREGRGHILGIRVEMRQQLLIVLNDGHTRSHDLLVNSHTNRLIVPPGHAQVEDSHIHIAFPKQHAGELTTCTQLINCLYYIIITPIYDFLHCCCLMQPHIKLDIRLISPASSTTSYTPKTHIPEHIPQYPTFQFISPTPTDLTPLSIPTQHIPLLENGYPPLKPTSPPTSSKFNKGLKQFKHDINRKKVTGAMTVFGKVQNTYDSSFV